MMKKAFLNSLEVAEPGCGPSASLSSASVTLPDRRISGLIAKISLEYATEVLSPSGGVSGRIPSSGPPAGKTIARISPVKAFGKDSVKENVGGINLGPIGPSKTYQDFQTFKELTLVKTSSQLSTVEAVKDVPSLKSAQAVAPVNGLSAGAKAVSGASAISSPRRNSATKTAKRAASPVKNLTNVSPKVLYNGGAVIMPLKGESSVMAVNGMLIPSSKKASVDVPVKCTSVMTPSPVKSFIKGLSTVTANRGSVIESSQGGFATKPIKETASAKTVNEASPAKTSCNNLVAKTLHSPVTAASAVKVGCKLQLAKAINGGPVTNSPKGSSSGMAGKCVSPVKSAETCFDGPGHSFATASSDLIELSSSKQDSSSAFQPNGAPQTKSSSKIAAALSPQQKVPTNAVSKPTTKAKKKVSPSKKASPTTASKLPVKRKARPGPKWPKAAMPTLDVLEKQFTRLSIGDHSIDSLIDFITPLANAITTYTCNKNVVEEIVLAVASPAVVENLHDLLQQTLTTGGLVSCLLQDWTIVLKMAYEMSRDMSDPTGELARRLRMAIFMSSAHATLLGMTDIADDLQRFIDRNGGVKGNADENKNNIEDNKNDAEDNNKDDTDACKMECKTDLDKKEMKTDANKKEYESDANKRQYQTSANQEQYRIDAKQKDCNIDANKKNYDTITQETNRKPEANEQDFRMIPCYPSVEDLKEPPKSLRPNIVLGPWNSVEHYLDTHFRLLREDLIGPLRDIARGESGRTTVYSDVIVSNPRITREGLVFDLLCSGIRSNSHEEKKLKFGSLLCLSTDDFRRVCCMATIQGTSIEQRRRGILSARFVQYYPAMHARQRGRGKFKMVECPSYFEAYRHVLVGLQSLSKESFPFKEYFVGMETEVMPPSYVKRGTMYKLGSLDEYVDILDPCSWPSAEALYFDGTQMLAFKTALTSEVALIQGPPGTGKTFIGLKIVETLLANDQVFSSPILVVCFTNHALDQFLEGVLKFCPKGVIRVGGRSKSPAVNEFNLLNYCRIAHRNSDYISDLKDERSCLYFLLQELRNNSQRTTSALQMSQTEIFFKETLRPYMAKDIYDQFTTLDDDASIECPIIHYWLEVMDLERLANQEWAQFGWNEAYPFKEDVIIAELESGDAMSDFEVSELQCVWDLCYEDKWRLYRYWMGRFCEQCLEDVRKAGKEYDDAYEQLIDVIHDIDVQVLSGARVIGMTTTGAAKHLKTLKRVAPKIVVIEEAAEVLEAHALLSISEKCEHVIMIGDHKQLRPNLSHYVLADEYNLDVSLFERLVNNGLPFVTLSLQHRMRPIISALLTPHIYDELRDHPSVGDYEDIRGVSSNLFLLDHRQPESSGGRQSTSYSNAHEVRFLVGLCQYLMQQEYEPKRITIVTTYSGQLSLLESTMAGHGLRDVSCVVVDNYQGEENDIVLLSLVRSNRRESIGFLNNANRMCVALSRARMGLFVIGNFELLECESDVWKPIVSYASRVGCIGPSLKLICSNHPSTMTEVSTLEDFDKVPDGGCTLRCGATMPCGHPCWLKCHPYDRGHVKVRCEAPCARKCARNLHDCLKRCWQDCKPCLVPYPRVYPACCHSVSIECYMDHLHFPCITSVPKVHPTCGHENFLPCSKSNVVTFTCQLWCSKTLACGHPCQLPCGTDCSSSYCMFPCEVILPCGHHCKGVCGRNCVCSELCQNQLSCGHVCLGFCGVPCPPCSAVCGKKLECGHPCCRLCSEECNTKYCPIPKLVKSPCGHEVTVPCLKGANVMDLLYSCNAPCLERLQCGHQCTGSCGRCAQGRRHIRCAVRTRKSPVCGHEFEGPCFVEPRECYERCEYICSHGSRCFNPCSWQCRRCNRSCDWQCPHFKCTRKCYEVCDRPPCDAACELPLPCGHPCVGLCGEKCPPLCIACGGRQEMLWPFKTHVDGNSSTRYVLLEDCGHVFEVKELDWFMELGGIDDGIEDFELKRCPTCRVLVCRTSRYNSVIKTSRQKLSIIKKMVQQNRRFFLDFFDDLLDQAKIYDAPGGYNNSCSKYEKIPDQMRRSLRIIESRLYSIEELNAVKSTVEEKFKRLTEWVGGQRTTVLEAAHFHRELLRLLYLLDVASSVDRDRNSAAGMDAHRAMVDKLTSPNRFTLDMERDLRKVVRSLFWKSSRLGSVMNLVVNVPKPTKHFVGWRDTWFLCAKCGHMYFKSGFGNVLPDPGCSQCNSATASVT